MGDLSQVDFIDLANDMCPEDFPEELRMTETTRKNFIRFIDVEDRGEVYYKMKNNPQRILCDAFWDIVRNMILTQNTHF